MQPLKTMTALLLLLSQVVFAQQNNSLEKSIREVDYLFGKFINDNRSNTDSNFLICTRFNKIAEENKVDFKAIKAAFVKKGIAELYSYVNYEYQDYKLILTPSAQNFLFDSLIANIKQDTAGEYGVYVNAVLGYYYENVERDHTRAELFYKKSFEKDVFPVLTVWRSMNFFRSGGNLNSLNREMAKTWLAECMQTSPGYAIGYVCAGHYAAWDGDFDKAASLFSQALKLEPNSLDANNAPGYWYNKRKMYETGIAYFEKIIQKHPRFIKAMINLCNIYKVTEQYEKAASVYKQCIAIDSLELSYYEGIAELYDENLKNHDAALYYYNEEAKIDPEKIYKPGVHYYSIRSDYKKALKYFNAYAKINPTATLYDLMGNCYSNLGKDSIPMAIKMYKKATELDTTKLHSYSQLGFLYNDQSEYDSSIFYYGKLMQLKMPSAKRKAYLSSIGFPYRNKVYLRMNADDFEGTYKVLADGAKKGNRGCKFLAFAMQNEFGFDNNEKNFTQAKFYYTEAAKLWPFNKLGTQGIMRLYKENKIAMADSADYNVWWGMDTAVLKSDYFTVTTYLDSTQSQSSVRLFISYPPNTHPVKWERDRLKEDFGLIITEADYERVAIIYREAKEKKKNFIDNLTVSNKEGNAGQDLTELESKNPDASDHTYETSESYRLSSIKYFKAGNFDKALQIAMMGLDLEPSNRLLIRLQCEILVVVGRTDEAFAIYDKYRQRKYFNEQEITYRQLFLIDIPDMEKLFPSKSADIQKAKLYLYSAKEKLKEKLVTYQDVLSSKNVQMLFDAAEYFADAWTKDSLQKSFACYEKLLSLKDSVLFNNSYIEAMARFKDVTGNEKHNPSVKKLEALFASSNYRETEKLLLRCRMKILSEPAFDEQFNKEMERLYNAGYFWDIMYNAYKYRATAGVDKNPNHHTRLQAAQRAIKMYLDLSKKIPAGHTDRKEIINLIADRCGGFAYSVILMKDYDYALKAALLANTLNPDEEYAKTNLPIAYILTGDFEKGKALYLKYKDQGFNDGTGRKFRKVFLDDIDDLRKNGIIHEDLDKIEILLNQN